MEAGGEEMRKRSGRRKLREKVRQKRRRTRESRRAKGERVQGRMGEEYGW